TEDPSQAVTGTFSTFLLCCAYYPFLFYPYPINHHKAFSPVVFLLPLLLLNHRTLISAVQWKDRYAPEWTESHPESALLHLCREPFHNAQSARPLQSYFPPCHAVYWRNERYF